MKIVLGVALVVLIALLGSRKTFAKVKLPLAARHIYLTGTEYIVVGLCLGNMLLGLLDGEALKGLDPLLSLALGWIGLMFGIQLEVRHITRFPLQNFLLAIVQALVTMLTCALPFLLLMSLAGAFTSDEIMLGALILGAIAMPTAQSSLALIQKELKLRRSKFMQLLIYVAGIDALLGLVVFGYLFCHAQTNSPLGMEGLVSLQYLAISVGLGVVMGALLHILTGVRCSQEELLLFTMGTVVLTAGAAAYLGISPLFVTMVAGFVIANSRGAKLRIFRVLSGLEKPFYIIVMLVGGAMLRPSEGWYVILGLAAAYIVLRMAGKITGGFIGAMTLRAPIRLPAFIGFGLVSQGGIAAAMAVSFNRAFGGELADSILLLLLVAIVVNELLSPFFARLVLKKES